MRSCYQYGPGPLPNEAHMDIFQTVVALNIDTNGEGWGDFVAASLAQLSVSHTALKLCVQTHMPVGVY